MNNQKNVLFSILGLILLVLMFIGCKKDSTPIVDGVDHSTSAWMSELGDERLLSHLSIPGTHDSGTEKITNNVLDGFGWAKTQNFSIEQQLNDGIRFLDIRLKNKGSALELYHGSVDCDIAFDKVLDWVKAFLSKNPREVILMSIKNEDEDEDITDNLNDYFGDTKWKDLFYPGNCRDRLPKLGEVRGKIVVFKRFKYAETVPYFIDWYTDWDGADVGSKTFQIKNTYLYQQFWYYIEDEYKENNTNKKLEVVTNHLKNAKKGNRDDLYLTFVSISYNPPFHNHTPYQYAWGGTGIDPAMNPSLEDFLFNNLDSNRWGIVALDYYNNEGADNNIVQYIINSNFF
jgi:1-phosphatidylinositol phosphodiesterase